ncbi:hypothetical protein K2173_016194 [Erythroxylum novogranatense]|uniref:Proline-rich protein PRCC n=1 Tax=Erythroxylum novogranatense TaxID=1862640 RepID=A0AAV8SG32_9ROSI|nr:hypothetical protein K2173_016194 [Erythroxylum novogranatense]
MESLVANYGSSDEEEEQHEEKRQSHPPKPIFSSSSSLFSSLPQPKVHHKANVLGEFEDPKPPPKPSSSIFSSLPQPKTQPDFVSDPNPKRVVQFKPPIIKPKPADFSDDDEEEEEEERDRKRRRASESSMQSSSVTSFLSSIPAPRNSSTLGALPSAAGSGRRSILQAEAPSSASDFQTEIPSISSGSVTGNDSHSGHEAILNQDGSEYASYGSYTGQEFGYSEGLNQSVVGGEVSSYGSYENYGDYGQYENNWSGGVSASIPESGGFVGNSSRGMGKRGKNEVIPTEIVEVKQDELMKDRPREDQVKLTGIAFGPAYQPASSKGKPSKLHKRKHQIGSLYFDMKQKEMELAERRAKGFLTKSQTQAKYGW